MAVTMADLTDASYKAQLELYHQRVAVLAFLESLSADADVRFDARPPATGEPREAWHRYADAIFQELEAAGFSAGDLVLICNTISRISNLLGEQLQQAQSTFCLARIADSP
jgi:cytoplasmic iron level regulating protein YaaA (DUF328/UPF0246 family)